jgi:hypothetical protein
MSEGDRREIGRAYAALDPADDDQMPGCEESEALFESMPIEADAWLVFERSQLCEDLHHVPHGGLIGTYEEAWFKAPDLPALIALIEAPGAAPHAARRFLADLASFARRAHDRGVGITLMVGG